MASVSSSSAHASAGVVAPAPKSDLSIQHCDMPLELRDTVVAAAREAIKACKMEKDAALSIKKALEVQTGGLWHVIVGQMFGASVAHENNMLIVFRVGKTNVMAFQSFDESSLVRKEGQPAPSPIPKAAAKNREEEEDEGAE